jgi:hypothetical protein
MEKDPINRVSDQSDRVVSEQRSAAWKARDEYWDLYAQAFTRSLQANGLHGGIRGGVDTVNDQKYARPPFQNINRSGDSVL